MSDDISRFSIPDLDSLPDDIRERIVGVQERSGFIPNVFLVRSVDRDLLVERIHEFVGARFERESIDDCEVLYRRH